MAGWKSFGLPTCLWFWALLGHPKSSVIPVSFVGATAATCDVKERGDEVQFLQRSLLVHRDHSAHHRIGAKGSETFSSVAASAISQGTLVDHVISVDSFRSVLHRRAASTCDLAEGVPPTVVSVFAGREDRMHLLVTYLDELLHKGLVSEVHFWDLTNTESNAKYVESLNGTSGSVIKPSQKSWRYLYRYYMSDGDFTPVCKQFQKEDFVFVKVDDDIVFIDTSRFASFTSYVAKHDETFIVHANVINNAVAAFYQYQHLPGLVQQEAPVQMMEYPSGGAFGSLWESGSAAAQLHKTFLAHRQDFRWDSNKDSQPCLAFQAPDTSEGQGRFSINFFGVRFRELANVAELVEECNGDDEHALTTVATRRGKHECIFTPLNVAHLGFCTQPETASVIPAYAELAKCLASTSAEDRDKC